MILWRQIALEERFKELMSVDAKNRTSPAVESTHIGRPIASAEQLAAVNPSAGEDMNNLVSKHYSP